MQKGSSNTHSGHRNGRIPKSPRGRHQNAIKLTAEEKAKRKSKKNTTSLSVAEAFGHSPAKPKHGKGAKRRKK